MRITDTHVFFYGGEFSNWHPCNFVDPHINKEFVSTEQAFMYFKSTHFNDYITADKILKETDPAKIKKLGREVNSYNETVWNNERLEYMIYVNNLKYSQNDNLNNKLLSTQHKTLVEASPYDKIWGIGLDENSDLIFDEKNWKGLNLLGKALMEVRKSL